MAIVVSEDIMKTGLDGTLENIDKMIYALIKTNGELGHYIGKEGIKVIKQSAQTFVNDPDNESDVSDCINQNSYTTSKKGFTTEVLFINNSIKATYIEYGTGIVGMNRPHPDTSTHPNGWEYYVDTPHKITSKYGTQGWIYGGEFQVGIPAQPFYYYSARVMRNMLPKWYMDLLSKNLGGMKK